MIFSYFIVNLCLMIVIHICLKVFIDTYLVCVFSIFKDYASPMNQSVHLSIGTIDPYAAIPFTIDIIKNHSHLLLKQFKRSLHVIWYPNSPSDSYLDFILDQRNQKSINESIWADYCFTSRVQQLSVIMCSRQTDRPGNNCFPRGLCVDVGLLLFRHCWKELLESRYEKYCCQEI